MNNKKSAEPFVRISKRDKLSLKNRILFTTASIVFALITGGIFIACIGYNPFLFYGKVLTGNFENLIYLKLLVRAIVPLLITSLGVAVAFKMKFWNIGAEGQFLMGAAISMTMALLIGNSLPRPLGIIVVLIMGGIGGAAFGLIPALLKVKFKTNETLLTLMLNYIALYLVTYFLKLKFYIKDANGIPTFKIIDNSLWLTNIKMGLFELDTALFIGLIILAFLFVYFKYTKQGYEVSVVGDSPSTAHYAGMKVNKIVVRTMFLSSFLIGIAGALQLTGSSASHTLSPNISGGVGWTAIIVAWLAKLNPLMILLVTVLMAILERGCSVARSAMGISEAMADILQGIILFSVLAFDFFIHFRVTFRKKKTVGAIDSEEILLEDNADGETNIGNADAVVADNTDEETTDAGMNADAVEETTDAGKVEVLKGRKKTKGGVA